MYSFVLIFVVGATLSTKSVSDISNWWSIVASLVNIILILVLVILCRKDGSSYFELINYEKGKTKVKQVVLISIITILVGLLGMYLAGFICYRVVPYAPQMMIAPIPLWLAVLNFFILPLSTAFAEDGLYLGGGVNQIRNKWLAVIIPAFFFALQHCFIPTVFDLKYIVYRFLSFLPLTIILCIYYYKKRNPMPIMIGHALIDVLQLVKYL